MTLSDTIILGGYRHKEGLELKCPEIGEILIMHEWLRNQWYGESVSFVGRILALRGHTVHLERNWLMHGKFTDTYYMLGSKWEMQKRSIQKVCPLGQLKLPWATSKGRWKWRRQDEKISKFRNLRQWLGHLAWAEDLFWRKSEKLG